MADITNQDLLDAIRGLYGGQANKMQLTGSSVALLLSETSVTVTAGGNSTTYEVVFTDTQYTGFVVGCLDNAGVNHNFKVQKARKLSAYTMETLTDIVTVAANNKGISARVADIGSSVLFRITNSDVSDRTYRLFVLGIKGA